MHSGGPGEACVRWGAHWRQLATVIEPSMYGSGVAFLSNYFEHLVLLEVAIKAVAVLALTDAGHVMLGLVTCLVKCSLPRTLFN